MTKKSKFYFLSFLIGFSIISISIELMIRFSGNYQTYSEKIGKEFFSYYDKEFESPYLIWNPNDSFELDHNFFKFSYKINQLGFRGDDFDTSSPDNLRILCLGDSFTEGVGATFEDSWPKQLEQFIVDEYEMFNIRIYNAGVSGSDPFYSYQILKDKLISIVRPDIVLLMINNSDVDDVIHRGGFSRFQSDGTVKYKKGPWFIFFYEFSHFARFIVHDIFNYNYLLINNNEHEEAQRSAIDTLTNSILHIDNLVKQNVADFKLILQPSDRVFLYGEETLFWNRINSNMLNTQVSTINLLPTMQEKINKNNFEEYYWVNEGHCKAKGYKVMAGCIYQNITKNFESSVIQ